MKARGAYTIRARLIGSELIVSDPHTWRALRRLEREMRESLARFRRLAAAGAGVAD